MFRPLSQRIRESGPIRLLLDNRLVRHFAGKPVTTAPTRRQTVLIGVVPALAAAALTGVSTYLVAFQPNTAGGLLAWITIAILLFGGLLIGRKLRSVICTILATGLYFVFIGSGAALVVSDYVLESRGDEVTAVVGPDIQDPTGCASFSAWRYRYYTPSHARAVARLDGTPLPGAIGIADNRYRSRHLYRSGEHVQVMVDPKNAVCLRAKSDVHTVVDTVTATLAAGCIAWVFLVAPLDWRIWRREKYEQWRDQAQ